LVIFGYFGYFGLLVTFGYFRLFFSVSVYVMYAWLLCMYIYISRVLQLNLWKNGMGQLNHARASSSAVGQLNLPANGSADMLIDDFLSLRRDYPRFFVVTFPFRLACF